MNDGETAMRLITEKDPQKKPSISKWEEYQDFMRFIMEYLPSIRTRRKQRVVLRFYSTLPEDREFYDYVPQDYVESLVRRYLGLPTVEQSRRELDEAVRKIQEKANH